MGCESVFYIREEIWGKKGRAFFTQEDKTRTEEVGNARLDAVRGFSPPKLKVTTLLSNTFIKHCPNTMHSRAAVRSLSRLATKSAARSQHPRSITQYAARPGQPIEESQDGRTTNFGFQTVAEAQKEAKVGAVFSSVASSYDTMNDLMSMGIHRLWKDHFVRSLNPGSQTAINQAGWNILDVAGGSGDIAFRMLDHATKVNGDLETKVTIADINADMLAEGRKRALQTPYANTGRLDFLEGNAESMPSIASGSLDLYTVSFGIRNFTNKAAAVREAYRMLKPGGVFACLEFSHVSNSLFNTVYKRWSFSAIPLIGQLVAGDRDSYQYLVESIEKFPTQEEFRDIIKDAGFVVPGKGYENLTGGISAIHRGMKPI
jgi:2-methoxy-6-polyprenyl-1,4-benzoquinol methylase